MSDAETISAVPAKWELEGNEYPLFAFDEKQVVVLPNGTSHHFKMWDDATEKKREDLCKTVVITSPHLINGENPVDAKSDLTRSMIAYYAMMIEGVSGVELDGHKPDEVLNAQEVVEGAILPNSISKKYPNGQPARILDFVGVPVRKAAAGRLYGGKIDVEKPDVEFDEPDDFDPFAEPDITEEIKKAEKKKTLYRLTLNRDVIVRQELGIENVGGRPGDPTHVIRYHFKEPDGNEFSRWELKGYRGFAVPLPKGGERAERYYNLDALRLLFNSLIERIEGASLNGKPIDLPSDRNDERRIAMLEQVPLSIKKNTVAVLFRELGNLGNS